MSYEFYKVMHLIGVFMILTGLVGVMILRMAGETMPPKPRKLMFLAHGIGMLLALVGGFGLAARLGYVAALPNWVWMKLTIWLLLGVGVAAAKRRGNIGTPLYVIFIGLGGLAGWLAITKPF